MKKNFTLFVFILLFPLLSFSQKYTISGVITDDATGETIIGATVLYGEGKGVISSLDGSYQIKVNPGTYHLKVSYVGYIGMEKDVEVTLGDVIANFSLKTPTLSEVEVVADMARARETPVAFTNVAPVKLQEELASRDIPMILNKTPGVYATQQGGGDGDARINVRGFSQRNLAVMIDGIPVNDMENGWVYWSNWFGLDAVTRNIQVQRGLGASKLALPSVGGTMNIITRGMEAKMGGLIKQEVGADGFLRTSLGLTTGPLKHNWNVTFAGSYKRGNGWVDNTWTKGWFFYLRVDKKLGDHTLTLSAMGAPQSHGQRSYKQLIKTYDKEYAAELGDVTAGDGANYGIRYNANWGHLNRWEFNNGVKELNSQTEDLAQSKNYYFKPQISLRDFWHVNDKLYISNILYVSLGDGGGTGTASSSKYGVPGNSTFISDSNGLVNFQLYYDQNKTDPKGQSLGILRASVNNHQWYGLLSTFNWEVSENLTISGGLDLRTYRAEHYMKVYDLLGGTYFLDNTNLNRYEWTQLHTGDKIRYNNDGLVRWGGLFGLVEYKKDNWSAFLNVTGAISGYKRIDYWRRKDVTVDNSTFREVIGYGDKFYYNGSDTLIVRYQQESYTSNDTVYVVRGGQTDYIVNANAYTIDSPEATATATDWKWFPGFTVKGGLNYNINRNNNVFLNLGYLSKAPRFNNVYDNTNQEFINIRNEVVKAVELGYSLNNGKVALNVNGYLTFWENRPLDQAARISIDDEPLSANINNLNALHKGIEIEFGWKPIRNLQWDQVVSIGDWRWTSSDSARFYNSSGQLDTTIFFNAKGVHVGDAAQIQIMESIRWEIIKSLYVSASITYFTKNYSQFDPMSLSPDPFDETYQYLDEDGNPRDSWKLPDYYLVDVNAGYRIPLGKFKLDVRASVLNLLDRKYISDAQNNDSYSTSTRNFDAASASVFFGVGRTFNFSLAITY